MEYNSKQCLSRGERLVAAVSLPLGNQKYRAVKRKNESSFFTLAELCKVANISPEQLNSLAKERLTARISGICRSGSRLLKDCVCVQLYEDGVGVLRWAIAHGAAVCVARENIPDIPCIIAEEPVAVYGTLCALYRSRSDVPATAVLGSIGKTTAKKMVEAVYKTQYNTFCDAGNDNQVDCVGYIAQHIPQRAELWVQEVSEDTPGCICQISKILRPKIAIVTAIDKSHISEYGSEAGILDEIRSIEVGMPSDGIVITSMDEENTRTLFQKDRAVKFVSLSNPEADYSAKEIEIGSNGLRFSILEKDSGRSYPVFLPYVYAKHNAVSALYAFAAGICSGIAPENILKGLAAYRAGGIRQNIYRARGVTVYADCYNAVPKSIRSAANACDTIEVDGKRVAVIGDVEETGEFEKEVHREIVEIIDQSKFDLLLTFGEKMKAAVLTTPHRESLTIKSFLDRKALNAEIRKSCRRGGIVLFKASHKSRLDRCIASVFPLAYYRNALAYALPQIIWRFRVINSWTLKRKP